MRKSLNACVRVLLGGAMALALASPAGARKHTDLTEILSNMNAESKKLTTISASLEYTKVTVLVDDKSTESGQFYFRKGKTPEICINFDKPEKKVYLFKNNKGFIYYRKINQIQEYNLKQNSDLVQQFLLLGFGTDTKELKNTYDIKYVQEEDMDGDTNVELELTPHKVSVGAQISKIQIWVSEESWLPTQQKFFQSGGDYLIARYRNVKAKRVLPASAFELNAPSNATHVPMN
jgi:outer membrane lipoprotein-sorting protein